MDDIEKARKLFHDAGLAFPAIPEQLAAQLEERGKWVFSTRPLSMSPYNLQHYVDEGEGTQIEDYTVLAHSGHGVNSYAIQYYLVQNPLRMFLHLGWGGVYMDAKESTEAVRDCFSMADQIVVAAHCVGRFQPGQRLMVVGSDFYGSYWLHPGESGRGAESGRKQPLDVLWEVHNWLTEPLLHTEGGIN